MQINEPLSSEFKTRYSCYGKELDRRQGRTEGWAVWHLSSAWILLCQSGTVCKHVAHVSTSLKVLYSHQYMPSFLWPLWTESAKNIYWSYLSSVSLCECFHIHIHVSRGHRTTLGAVLRHHPPVCLLFVLRSGLPLAWGHPSLRTCLCLLIMGL